MQEEELSTATAIHPHLAEALITMGVTNLDPDLDTDIIRDLLTVCGKGMKFTRMQDPKTKKGKPYGIVEFRSIEDCLRATRLLDELVVKDGCKPIKLRTEDKFKNILSQYLEYRTPLIQEIDTSVETENVNMNEVITLAKTEPVEIACAEVPRIDISELLDKFTSQYGSIVSKTPTTEGITYLFQDGTMLADKLDGSQVIKEASQGLIEVIQPPAAKPVDPSTISPVEIKRHKNYNECFKFFQTNNDEVPPLPDTRNPLDLPSELLNSYPKCQVIRDNDCWLRISSILSAYKKQLLEEQQKETESRKQLEKEEKPKKNEPEKDDLNKKNTSRDRAVATRNEKVLSRDRYDRYDRTRREDSGERYGSRYSQGRRRSDRPEKRYRSVSSDIPEKRRQRSCSSQSNSSSSSRPQPRQLSTRRTRHRRSSEDYHQRRDKHERTHRREQRSRR